MALLRHCRGAFAFMLELESVMVVHRGLPANALQASDGEMQRHSVALASQWSTFAFDINDLP